MNLVPKQSIYQIDLLFDPVTLILDLDMVKIFHHTQIKFMCNGKQKLVPERTQTDR